MSRQDITDKGGTQPKSEWFGFKYRVTPESSKLLQEAVFKDGGKWTGSGNKFFETDASFIYVKADGIMSTETYFGDFQDHELPEKKPPQIQMTQPVKVEPKEFRVGKYYKCVDNTYPQNLTEGKYYKCTFITFNREYLGVDTNVTKDSQGWSKNSFDISSESDYDPNAKISVAKDLEGSKLGTPKAILEAVNFVHDFKPNDFSTTKEETNMSIQRKSVKVELFDNDQGLPVEHSLVGAWDNYVTEDSDSITVQEIISTGEVATLLEDHNKVRITLVDDEILNRTGNAVKLRPIKLKNLTWIVDGRKIS